MQPLPGNLVAKSSDDYEIFDGTTIFGSVVQSFQSRTFYLKQETSWEEESEGSTDVVPRTGNSEDSSSRYFTIQDETGDGYLKWLRKTFWSRALHV